MRYTSLLRLASCLVLLAGPAVSTAQTAPVLAVRGAVTHELDLTPADLGAMPRATVVTNNGGIATTYEGVSLADVLKKAGVPMGSSLRGPALSTYVVAAASDGYRVVFSVGELDPDMTDNQFLLADKADGRPLFGENGSFRLVVPKDKRGARSIRMLTSITVVQAQK